MTSLAIMARSRLRDQRPKTKVHNNHQIIAVSTSPRSRTQGLLHIGNLMIPCALGKNGIGILKHEGDGKTPLAEMEVLFGFYRLDRWPVMKRQPWLHPVSKNLGWCDAPDDQNYNRAITRPNTASHETLVRDDGLYDCVIVLNWNMFPRARSRGSAIFMHIARNGYQPTAGCIAISKHNMMRMIEILRPGTAIKTLA